MKKILISLIIITCLSSCSESIPTVKELVEDENLYRKMKAECNGKPKNFEDIKCMNFHRAADKRKFRDITFPKYGTNKKEND